MPRLRHVLMYRPSFLLLIFVLFGHADAPAQEIEFQNDILPILEKHCSECHGNGNTEGDLSLDSVADMLRGGHSGSPILSAILSDSELYLRITSLSDGYRMPKKGEPLPQLEIDKIAKWMQTFKGLSENRAQVASAGIPNAQSAKNPTPTTPGLGSVMKSGEVVATQSQIMVLVIASVVISLLFCWLFYRLFAGRSRRKKFDGNRDRRSAFLSMAIGATSCLILLGFAFLYWRCGKLVQENESLRSQVELYKPKMAAVVEVGPNSLPMAPHPLHPPRLGGQYYRGNDERDDSLFNHGFYRTATIDLHLVDGDGNKVDAPLNPVSRNRLRWGDAASENISLEIRIERAPNATRELFSERVHSQTAIEHYSQSSPGVQDKMKFDVVEAENLWLARVPLPPMADGNTQHSDGMVYLMYGVQPGPKNLPRPHFAVRYDLNIADGKVSDDSVLWMGSIYTLNNRVLVPGEDEILLDRWFDWRPIPVIEGEGSKDASLLGIDEHLDK